MIWLKSLLGGIVAALISVFAVGVSAIAVGVWQNRWLLHADVGSGGIGAVSFGISDLLLLPVVVGFGIGFWWTWQRSHRRARMSG